MQTLTLTAWPEMIRLRREWERILLDHADSELLGHDWFAQCWKSFPESRRAEVLTFCRGDAVMGILPLRRQLSWGVRRMAFLDDRRSPRLDVIAAPGDRDAVLWAAGEHLAGRRDWDVVDLNRLRQETAEGVLRLWPELGLVVRVRGEIRQRYLPLDGGWPQIAARMKPSLRKNLRRKEGQLRERGNWEVRLHTGTAGLDELLDRCFEAEASGWKGRQGTAMRCQPELARFYRQLAFRLAQRGCLRIYGLWLGEDLLAFQYCVAGTGCLASLKIGYAERYAPYSPGQLLQWQVVRQAAEEGLRRFDMLGDNQPAQADWTASTEPLVNLRIYNGTVRGTAVRLRSQAWRWWRGAGTEAGVAAPVERS